MMSWTPPGGKNEKSGAGAARMGISEFAFECCAKCFDVMAIKISGDPILGKGILPESWKALGQ